MLPDRVSNPGPLTYESGDLPIVLRGPANTVVNMDCNCSVSLNDMMICEANRLCKFYMLFILLINFTV